MGNAIRQRRKEQNAIGDALGARQAYNTLSGLNRREIKKTHGISLERSL